MSLLQRFQEYVKQNNLFSSKDSLLVAASGGVDSVVLCELCKQAGHDFTIAHCNFQLRGEESDRDEKFVNDMGKRYGVEVVTKKFETEKYAKEKKISIQEAARDLRYEWFHSLASSPKSIADRQVPDLILTAHHSDDNVETVLMNFCRGTGLPGLEGIPIASGHIRRPLLAFWKDELIQFAKDHKLEFVEDSSNASSKYTRNLFRNEIIPLIGKAYPQAKQNLRDNIDRFTEIEKLYRIATGEIKRKLLKKKGDEIHIPVKQLMSYRNRALIYEIISDFGFSEKHIDEVIKLAESESGKYIQSSTASTRIIKFRSWFIISANKPLQQQTIIIEEGRSNLQSALGNILIKIFTANNTQLPNDNATACLDAGGISFPLIVRRWKEGDYFYPLGLRKKKKLSRFFIDQKLSKTDREKIWVLEMNKKILWVVGLRIDDRFKITDKTERILKVSISNG